MMADGCDEREVGEMSFLRVAVYCGDVLAGFSDTFIRCTQKSAYVVLI